MITGKNTTKSDGEKQYDITVDNGDLKLIDELVSAYSFKDRDSLIKFGISTLLEGTNNDGIYIIKSTQDGRKVISKINPPSDMLETKSE